MATKDNPQVCPYCLGRGGMCPRCDGLGTMELSEMEDNEQDEIRDLGLRSKRSTGWTIFDVGKFYFGG